MNTPSFAPTLDPAVLVLEDGSRHAGRAYGARGTTIGEVVFATGMTGYQETLTDPSYAGQIVLQTAPHIGNTGMNSEDVESRRIWVSGYIVRDPSRVVSNWRSEESLDVALERDGIVGISGIDTRAVTRVLRSAGSMRGAIFSDATCRQRSPSGRPRSLPRRRALRTWATWRSSTSASSRRPCSTWPRVASTCTFCRRA